MSSEASVSHTAAAIQEKVQANVPMIASKEEKPPSKRPSDFIFLKELGEGSFSTVHLVKERATEREYAAKVISKKQVKREKKIQQVYREKEALVKLSTFEHKHPFITQVFFTFQDSDSLYIVMSLAKNGDLLSLLKKKGGKLDLNATRLFTSEIVAALAHMHALNILHRDLKPENILLTDSKHILISDFGSAKILDSSDTDEKASDKKRRGSFVGTAQYVSPEVLNGHPVQQACDYWALGVIIYQLLTGLHAFYDVSEYLIFRRIIRVAYIFPENFPEIAADLVKKLLVLKPEERYGSIEMGGAETVKKHRFFDEIDWENIGKVALPF